MSHYNSLAVERVWGVTTFIQIVVTYILCRDLSDLKLSKEIKKKNTITYNLNLKFNIITENSQKILKHEESTRDDSDTT
jgi:uncharacterized membrane protein YjfL (UPF0719 family)